MKLISAGIDSSRSTLSRPLSVPFLVTVLLLAVSAVPALSLRAGTFPPIGDFPVEGPSAITIAPAGTPSTQAGLVRLGLLGGTLAIDTRPIIASSEGILERRSYFLEHVVHSCFGP